MVAILAIVPASLLSQSISTTVHNLSASGPGSIRASSESEICVFCHTPHSSSPRAPLWNRSDPGTTYTLYNSSTVDATIGQPSGSSILCLSCHDGTIALGHVLSRASDIQMVGGITTMPSGNTNLTTDLSDDHPISFTYDAALATADGELKNPSSLTGQVQLENGKVQCVSCHDPHKNVYSDFLVVNTKSSELCLECHDKTNWSQASHKTSTATWNGSGTDPWPHTSYTNVADNACENCHNPHNAGGHPRLLNYSAEESNCLSCHNGNVASTDIQTQLNKAYRHNVAGYTGLHVPDENALVQTKHVECVDCHDPHQAKSGSANPPAANSLLLGVKGVDTNGNAIDPVQNEYEVCYRCHADSNDKPGSPTTRQIAQNNVRLEFDLSNPSYHPVEGAGKNNDVPSLISPWTTSSKVYCTDCHASNGNGSPDGPHGSIYPHILKYRYETADYTQESYQNYELCYQCHNRSSILGDQSFRYHKRHIQNEDTPCNVCHDPHGISSSQGNSTNNTHLINFDVSVVQSVMMGTLKFQDDGKFKGRCYLRCHGKRHNPKRY